MEDRRLTLISAATATHNPRITNVRNLMKAGFRPLSLEEFSLIPTDWVYSPNVVNFNTRKITSTQAAAMKNGVGMGIPGINPPK